MLLQVAELADIFTGRLREEVPLAFAALASALLTCPNLHTINFSDNAFGLSIEAPLVSLLSKHGPLQHLILNNNGLGPFCGTSIARSLTKLAQLKKSNPKFPPLETIICGRNRLENGSMEAWAEAFRENDQMKLVKMVQNGIRPEGISILINGLSGCRALETLDLQDNTFTLRGSQALAKALVGWPRLVELGVGDCLLGPRGSTIIAEALGEGKTKSLRILRLQYNGIDEGTANAFRIAVDQAMPNLEKLELNGNKFSEEDEVVQQLREIFQQRGYGELDELDDMEEEYEEESEEESEKEESEKEEEAEGGADVIKRVEENEARHVALERDEQVNRLADMFARKARV